MIKMVIFLIYEKKGVDKPIYLMIAFQIIILAISLLTYSHWSSIPLLVMSLIYAWAIWQKKQLPLLIITIAYSVTNILYNAYASAYTCVFLEATIMLSSIITLIKLRLNNKHTECN